MSAISSVTGISPLTTSASFPRRRILAADILGRTAPGTLRDGAARHLHRSTGPPPIQRHRGPARRETARLLNIAETTTFTRYAEFGTVSSLPQQQQRADPGAHALGPRKPTSDRSRAALAIRATSRSKSSSTRTVTRPTFSGMYLAGLKALLPQRSPPSTSLGGRRRHPPRRDRQRLSFSGAPGFAWFSDRAPRDHARRQADFRLCSRSPPVRSGALSPGEVAFPLRRHKRKRSVRVLLAESNASTCAAPAAAPVGRRLARAGPGALRHADRRRSSRSFLLRRRRVERACGRVRSRSERADLAYAPRRVRGRRVSASPAPPRVAHVHIVTPGPPAWEDPGVAELASGQPAARLPAADPAPPPLLLIEAADRVLTGFPPSLSAKASARCAGSA